MIFADHSDIEEHVHPSPSTIDDVACPQPHEDYEHHEVAMVVVTDAVEHPGFGGQRSRNTSIHTFMHTHRALWLRNWHEHFAAFKLSVGYGNDDPSWGHIWKGRESNIIPTLYIHAPWRMFCTWYSRYTTRRDALLVAYPAVVCSRRLQGFTCNHHTQHKWPLWD